MSILSKEQILSAPNLAREKVEMPEWGGDVWITAISAYERDQMQAYLYSKIKEGATDEELKAYAKSSMADMKAILVARCLIDDAGNRLLTDDEAIDFAKRVSPAAFDRIHKVADRLNAVVSEGPELAEKNS